MALPSEGHAESSSTAAPITLQVTDSAGAPLGKAPVRLVASIPGGKELRLPDSITTPTGSAAINPPVNENLRRMAAQNDDWVNFETQVMTEDGPHFSTFPRRLHQGKWDVRSDDKQALKTVTVVARRRSTPVDPAARAVKPMAGAPHATCVWWGPISSAAGITVIGELHVGGDAKGNFNYGSTADSDIGVSYNYGSGWKVSGAAHVGTGTQTVSGWADRGPIWRYPLKTQFTYHKYEYITDANCGGASGSKTYYKAQVARWDGGATVGASLTNQYAYCTTSTNRVDYSPGTRLARSSYRAYTYDGAVAVFGASLTAKSGYSTNVDFELKFGSNPSHLVCGNDGPPTSSSKVWSR
ncbi:MAG: hypothetical protein U0Q15_15425 [Kineosporiaceae bacterium]